jgi:hypothetical protein
MHKDDEQLRRRVRAIKRQPSRFIVEGMERTLANLPPRRARSIQDKLILAGAIGGGRGGICGIYRPPIVAAAGALIERCSRIAHSGMSGSWRCPKIEKLAQSVAALESFRQENRVEARGEFFGVGARIDRVADRSGKRIRPFEYAGLLRLRLVYDGIPAIDPNDVDFVLVMDGREIPYVRQRRPARFPRARRADADRRTMGAGGERFRRGMARRQFDDGVLGSRDAYEPVTISNSH